MSQIKVTVKMGEDQLAVITWSEEYGPMVMAQKGIEVDVEEVNPRMAMVPELVLAMRGDRPVLRSIEDMTLPEGEESPAAGQPPTIEQLRANRSGGLPECFTCDHPAHPEVECTWDMSNDRGGEPGRLCGCSVYLT